MRVRSLQLVGFSLLLSVSVFAVRPGNREGNGGKSTKDASLFETLPLAQVARAYQPQTGEGQEFFKRLRAEGSPEQLAVIGKLLITARDHSPALSTPERRQFVEANATRIVEVWGKRFFLELMEKTPDDMMVMNRAADNLRKLLVGESNGKKVTSDVTISSLEEILKLDKRDIGTTYLDYLMGR